MAVGRSILIVEDEQIVAMDLQQTLQDFGYDAYATASSAKAAIARASERCPDLVLMDIRIQGQIDGVEAARILKSRFSIPIVFLTAHADEATIDRAKQVEPEGYLLKPVKPGELRSVVEIALHRFEMQRRLRERERWFATTLRSIGDAVITVDLAERVTFMNPVAESLTGVRLADALERPISEVVQLEYPKGELPPPVRTVLRENRTFELREAHLRNRVSGALRVIHDSAAPVVDEQTLLGAVMVFRDVTERLALAKRLELSDRLASLGAMAAGVAHEINNPLAVILANADVLDQFVAEARASQLGAARLDDMASALSDVHSAARRIASIVSDLRVFSRPSPTKSHDADLEGCIEWALRSTAKELAGRARVSKQIEASPRVRADEVRLGQVLVNLLSNAAQAIPEGGSEDHEVTVSSRMAGEGWVVVEVRDTGTGMTREVIDRVFEPFYTTKPSGTGLGLAISHGLVRSFGGTIEVESDVGKGTTFRLKLPTAEASPDAPPPAPRRNPPMGSIIVVDDEPMVLRVLQRVLARHTVVVTSDAREALALITEGARYDVVLTDLMMPGMSGIDFYERLLEIDPLLARRCVFMTGGAASTRARDFLDSVTNRIVDKPFKQADLLAAVEAGIEEVRGQSALEQDETDVPRS